MLNLPGIKKLHWLIAAFLVGNLTGCATAKDPQDPLEPLNRQLYAFNEVVDSVVYRPVAKTYNFITPTYVQARVTNFFNNLDLIPTVANDILQLNVNQILMDSSRFVVNSTFGLAGLYDPAAKYDLPSHHSDVGLTFARWGWKKSSYFVIPFVGPSTIRDGIAMPPNIYLNVWPYISPAWIGYSTFALNKINQRAALLSTDKLVKDAFDPYVFVRDAYLQYRQGQIDKIGAKHTAADSTSAKTVNNNGDTFVSANGNDSSSAGAPASANDADTYVPPGPEQPVSNSITNIHGSKRALDAQITNPTPVTQQRKKNNNHSSQSHHKKHKVSHAHAKHKNTHAEKNTKKHKKIVIEFA